MKNNKTKQYIVLCDRSHTPQVFCLIMSSSSTQMFLHTKPYGCSQTFPLVGRLMLDGNGPLVNHKSPGALRSGRNVTSQLLGCLYPPWPQWSDVAVHKGFAVMVIMMMSFRQQGCLKVVDKFSGNLLAV